MQVRKRYYCIILAASIMLLFCLDTYQKYIFSSASQSTSIKTFRQVNDDFLTIGFTERHQLMIYLSNSEVIDKQSASYEGHNVAFKSLSLTIINELPTIIIRMHDARSNTTETSSKTTLRGGNSYRTICTGTQHRQACAYVDHANDTYDVVCRLYDACNDVSIYVTYVAFGAYRWDGVYVNQLVWRHNVCYPVANKFRTILNNYSNSWFASYSGWFRTSESQPLRWVFNHGHELPTNEQMQSCLDDLPSPIEFIGDSQLRYAYNDLIPRIDNNARNFSMGKIKTRFVYAKYAYSYVGFSVDHLTNAELRIDPRGVISSFKVYSKNNSDWTMFSNMRNVQDELDLWKIREKHRANDLLQPNGIINQRRLIISFGTWDTMRVNIKYFVFKVLPMLRTFFDSRRSDAVLSKVKIILTTVPAVNEGKHVDQTHPKDRYDLRNNALLAAANRLLIETVLMYENTAVVDWFGVTVSCSSEATDGVHYLLRENQRTFLTTILNDVGLVMLRLLVEQVCK